MLDKWLGPAWWFRNHLITYSTIWSTPDGPTVLAGLSGGNQATAFVYSIRTKLFKHKHVIWTRDLLLLQCVLLFYADNVMAWNKIYVCMVLASHTVTSCQLVTCLSSRVVSLSYRMYIMGLRGLTRTCCVSFLSSLKNYLSWYCSILERPDYHHTVGYIVFYLFYS